MVKGCAGDAAVDFGVNAQNEGRHIRGLRCLDVVRLHRPQLWLVSLDGRLREHVSRRSPGFVR